MSASSTSGHAAPRSRFHFLYTQPDAWQQHTLDAAALRRLSKQATTKLPSSSQPRTPSPPLTASNGHAGDSSSVPLLRSHTATHYPSAYRAPHMAASGPSPPSKALSLTSPTAEAASAGRSRAKEKDEESSDPLLSITDSSSTLNPHHLRSRFSQPPSSSFLPSLSPPFPPTASLTHLHSAAMLPNPHAHHQFQQLLNDELDRVNAFIVQRLSELRGAFTAIETQSVRLTRGRDPEAETDGDDPTLDPVKAGYVDLYSQVMLLQSFAISHSSMFHAIIRSYALFSAAEKERYAASLEGAEMNNNRGMCELIEHIELVYAELWGLHAASSAFHGLTANGLSPDPADSPPHHPSASSASASLLSKAAAAPSGPTSPLALLRAQARALLFTHQQQPTSWSTFDRGMRFGITLLLFFWVLWDCVVDARLRPLYPVEWVQSVLPVYRGIGVLLLLEWGWGCNLYMWDKYRVNYLALLELDPRTSMTYTEVFDEATTASMMFLANFLLYFKILRQDFPPWIPAGYFPILLFLYMLYKLLPWSGQGRSVIWSALAQVVLSPFGRVTFLTVYTGDILTSLVKPIIDWCYTLCFLLTLEWVDDTVKDEVCLNSRLFNFVIIPLLSALPLWFRFMQCLRRYIDTRKRWPHLVNAGKYALSHSVVLFGAFHHTLQDSKSGDTYRVWWIVSLVISSLYSYLWDIFMDWGMGSRRHAGLRDQLMYPGRAVYYLSMVADLFLRFAWSLTLVPRGDNAPFAPSVIVYLQPLLAMAEVIRRCMWGALRLEYEHISVIGYKKVEGSASAAAGATTAAPPPDGRSGWSIILEVAIITMMVLSIGMVAALTAN